MLSVVSAVKAGNMDLPVHSSSHCSPWCAEGIQKLFIELMNQKEKKDCHLLSTYYGAEGARNFINHVLNSHNNFKCRYYFPHITGEEGTPVSFRWASSARWTILEQFPPL